MDDSFFSDFVLIGGTALSLHIGHRLSVDIDLTTVFNDTTINIELLKDHLYHNYNKNNVFHVMFSRQSPYQFLTGHMNDVKVDFVISQKTPNVNPPLLIEGLRLASLEDIAAMKLNPIKADRREIKDFYDIACLSNLFSLNRMCEFFLTRYPNEETIPDIMDKLLHAPSLIHGKIDLLNQPNKRVDWQKVRTRITEMVAHPEYVFPDANFMQGVKTKRRLKL